MKKFSIIENLEIKENIINENMMEILCKGISENESLKTLKISDCTFNKNQFEQLVKAILQKKKQSIETL
jgi:Ran GTPase-activating protein (RanGAP) involved in mRNA processing and transport